MIDIAANKEQSQTNENYTVYCHVCPNNKRYIGMTGNDVDRRWQNGCGYKCNQYFYRAIKKYGWDKIKHLILESNLSYDVACACEREYIAKFQSNDRKHGYNLDSGGNSQKTHSEETKKKIGDAHRGMKRPPESVKRINEKLRNNKKLKEICRKNNEAKKIPVVQYDLQGDRIAEFESFRAASRATGATKNGISNCVSGKYCKAGEYQWTLSPGPEKIPPYKHGNAVGVSQYTLDDKYINTYQSVSEAAFKVGTDYRNISACVGGYQKTAAGFKWKKSGGYLEQNN